MPIRIDENNISLSVKDLVPASYNNAILSSFPLPQRGAMGRQAQTWLQAGKKQRQGIFHSEYVVNRAYPYGGYNFIISGRIDGIYQLPGRVEIEEIKSVILKKNEFAKVHAELYPHFIEQLLVYAYLLQDELKGLEILPFLVLINLIDNKDKIFPVKYNRLSIENFLFQRFQSIIRLIEEDNSEKKKRTEQLEQINFSLPESRPQQVRMMEAVDTAIREKQHLLVSAPTGTGKTAASLIPAIKIAYAERKKIIFVTSKNSQQQIVLDTLRGFTDQGLDIKTGFLKASRRMCANDIFFCHEAHCAYARDYRKRTDESGILFNLLEQKIIIPDEVYNQAVKKELCPFELNVDVNLNCDIVVGDYNYVFDPAARLRKLFISKDYSDWILIIDEAHNLYERGRQYLSPQIDRQKILLLIKSLKSKKDVVFKSLKKALTEIDNLFDHLQIEGETDHSNQQYFETDLNRADWLDRFSYFETAYLSYLIYKIRKGILIPDDPFESFYFNFRRFIQTVRFKDPSFIIYYNADGKGILNIQCLDPSRYLAEIMNSFHSVIAMSATLDPIHYYKEVLGFAEERTKTLQLDSPFPKQNRKIIITPHISTRFKDRMQSYPQIAEIIKETIKIRKGNYLAFFPGYTYMQNVNVFLGNAVTDKIVQRPGMSESERDRILEKLKENDQPHLLMAVMGGIFSEGVDYNGEMAIGVFVISPALPQYGYERELLNHYYDTKNGLGKEYAYLYPGMNKVIQAVGRLIRSNTDKGVILLIGERFAEDEFNILLPDYWVDKKDDLLITRNYKQAVKSFWRMVE
jgi:DNA excision repair protein ERCC-2